MTDDDDDDDEDDEVGLEPVDDGLYGDTGDVLEELLDLLLEVVWEV